MSDTPAWKIGDKVFVVADNLGSPGEIIDYRESREHEQGPASHWKVRTDDGQEFWAFDFEIHPATEESS